MLGGGDKWGKYGRADTMNLCGGKVCPCSFLHFYFYDYFLPISYQSRQEADGEDKCGGEGDG